MKHELTEERCVAGEPVEGTAAKHDGAACRRCSTCGRLVYLGEMTTEEYASRFNCSGSARRADPSDWASSCGCSRTSGREWKCEQHRDCPGPPATQQEGEPDVEEVRRLIREYKTDVSGPIMQAAECWLATRDQQPTWAPVTISREHIRTLWRGEKVFFGDLVLIPTPPLPSDQPLEQPVNQPTIAQVVVAYSQIAPRAESVVIYPAESGGWAVEGGVLQEADGEDTWMKWISWESRSADTPEAALRRLYDDAVQKIKAQRDQANAALERLGVA